MKKTGYLVLLLLFLLSSVWAGRREEAVEVVEMKNASEVSLECELGAGEFTIRVGDINEAVIAEIFYDRSTIDYFIDADTRNNIRLIDIESEHRRSHSIDTDDNVWDIQLSDKYPYEIDMEIGACDADFDFGGLSLSNLVLQIGAASGRIEFSKPNRTRLHEFDIEAGASSLSILDIGNSNFERFSFSGGAGSFELDFSGEYSSEGEIEVEIGLGDLDIVLPEDIPVRIYSEGDNWLSSVDLNDRDLIEVRDDVYESEEFDSAKTRLVIRLEVGLGAIDVTWR